MGYQGRSPWLVSTNPSGTGSFRHGKGARRGVPEISQTTLAEMLGVPIASQKLLNLLFALAFTLYATAQSATSVELVGVGYTFPLPLYTKWFVSVKQGAS